MQLRALSAIALTLLVAPPLTAQRARLLPASCAPDGLAWCGAPRTLDADGDGVLDIALPGSLTVTGTSSAIAVLLGRHGASDDGSFDAPLVAAAPNDGSLAIGDVTGDGVPDVVTGLTKQASPTEQVAMAVAYPGDGSGGLLSPITSNITGSSQLGSGRIELADFDDDGALDAAALVYTAGQHEIYTALGHGDGGFEAFTPLGAAYSDFVLADVNGNGKIDIVGDTGPTTWLGAGNGHFKKGLVGSPAYGGATAIDVADLDASGTLDYLGLISGGFIDVRQGQPDGSLDTVNALFGNSQVLYDVIGRDLDEDGITDIVTVLPVHNLAPTPQASSLLVWRGEGAMQYESPQLLPLGGEPVALATADVDSDGEQDLILEENDFSASYGAPPPYVGVAFRRATVGAPGGSLADVFAGPAKLALPAAALRLAAGDVGGDGALDLLALLDSSSTPLVVLSGEGGGTLGAAQAASVGAPGLGGVPLQPHEILLGDVNADGAADLLLAGTGPDGLLSAPSLGDGVSFGSPLLFGGGDADDALLADLDGDGRLDVAAARSLAGLVAVHLGAGDGSFAPAVATPVANQPTALAVADLNGDGALDLVATSSTASAQAAVLLGVVGGHFTVAPPVATPERPAAVALTDLDGNGAPELATIAAQDALLDVRAGLGGGAFGPAEPATLEAAASALLATDLDRDGRADLLVLVPSRNVVEFLGGDGAGGLLAAVDSFAGNAPVDALVADLDTDGFPDLVSVGVDAQGTNGEVWAQLGQSGPFGNLGYGHPDFGAAHLAATGSLAANEKVSFTVSGVASPATGFLILGFDAVHQAFEGGTLVPQPDIAVPMRPGLPIAGRWPAGVPAGSAVYFQAWFAAGGMVVATNALVGIGQ